MNTLVRPCSLFAASLPWMTPAFTRPFFFLLVCSALGASLSAQPWTQVGSDIDGEAAVDLMGYSVSLSSDGQTVAIGAPFNDGGGSEAGLARVYKLVGGVWTQQGGDFDGEAANDRSGFSVSLSSDGQTVAIGAPYNDGGGSNSGRVRVYKLVGGVWTQQGGDIDGEAANDQSGYSVSLSSDGQTVAIGAHQNDDGGSNAGHVRVYKLTGGVWTQQGGDINGEAAGNFSGRSVSLSSDGQTVAIGAINNSGGGPNSGHVRVYKLTGGVWTQQGGDIDGEAAGDISGWSVSLSSDGQTVAIGAPRNDGAGDVRVYNRLTTPEINLKGNTVSIADGDAMPSATDHTDFENACLSGSTVVRTFTIENTGAGALNITAINLGGTHAADFTVGGISLPAAITASGSTTFTVTFDPSEAGLRSATVSIINDDADENPYDFAIQGTGDDCFIDFSGTILWEHDGVSGVKDATVNLSGSATGSDLTDVNGDYFIATAVNSGNFTLTPVKTANKLNGVTVADATTIQQHTANVTLITDAYKQVAADVNKSNSITTLDASIINQSILGNPAALAQFKTSWRFVPTNYALSVPPWGFPEKRSYTNINTSQTDQDFYGIKTGDVVTTFADPANFGAGIPMILNARDQWLESGKTATVEFTVNQLDDLAAFQFALKFDVEKLELADIQPLTALPISVDNFGTFNIAEGEIRAVWSQARSASLEEAAPVFLLKFNVLQSGSKLSEVLNLNETALPALSYSSDLAESGVALRFMETTGADGPASASGLQLLQNRPNPFNGTTAIGFVLPESCEAQLRVFDVSGRMSTAKKGQYPAGRNEETFDLEGVTGVLWYELVTPYGVLTKKMVAMQK